MSGGGTDAATVRAALERLLREEGLPAAPREEGAVAALLDWLGELLSEAFGGVLGGGGPFVAALAAALLAAAALAAVLVRARRRRATARTSTAGTRPFDAERARRAEALGAEARRRAAAGDARTALRLHWFALVVRLGDAGELEFKPSRTDRELLALGRPSPPAAARLGAWLARWEPKLFGTEEVTQADLDEAEAAWRDWAGGAAPRGREGEAA